MLPPYTQDHLPTIGPFPETMTPTTTTLFPPPPPPGKCIDDGQYRGDGNYEKFGEGLCVDDGKLAISFKKRRELSKKNFECVCKEACDKEPGCIGFSTNANEEETGLACRVYGLATADPRKFFPTLVDRWLDLGSMGSPRYKGQKITGADGEKGMVCFRKAAVKAGALMQMPEAIPAPPRIMFIERHTSTSELLEWQREQLSRCREQQGTLLSLLQAKGCQSGASSSAVAFLRMGQSASDVVMPNECECHCPDCNFWQLPPPICHEPTPPPTATVPPLPSGVMVVTGPPRVPTPPPMPVQIPLPPLPPIGNQFLPTLGPAP